MADPFLAEIRIFPFNFAPSGWAFCNGQIISIYQNTALFSLLGTYYGGNGTSTFALPNFQGRSPLHANQGVGLSVRSLGETGGTENVTLLSSEIPAHSHAINGVAVGNAAIPSSLVSMSNTAGRPAPNLYTDTLGTPVNMNILSLSNSGGGLPHNNLMPFLVLNFCIAIQGVFPSRW